MVGMMLFLCLVSSNCREQKKFAPNISGTSSSPSKWCATLYAIVDLPDPAWPTNQKTNGLLDEESSAHAQIRLSTLTRVPGVQASRITDPPRLAL